MFKTAAQAAASAVIAQPAQAQRDDAEVAVKRLFMLFHGWYGNLFLSKFATGDLDESGKDRGIKSARMVWVNELREFDQGVLVEAARRCKEAHPEFPPSLPQFVAICKAARPRKASVQGTQGNQIGMSDELRSEYSRKVREQAVSRLRARMDAETGHMRVDSGVSGLRQLIARAVALAGGDEVAVLRRLEVGTAKGVA